MRKKILSLLLDAGVFIIAGAVYGFSVNTFTAPNHIAPGGITGIATILNFLFGTPIGTMIIMLNLPLFALGIKIIGFKFVVKTIAATLTLSVSIDVFAIFLKPYTGNMILAALYGGVLSGVSLAMFFLREATTGGSDLAASLIKKRFRHIPLGRLILIMDFCVITAASIAFKSFESALYAIIAIFTSSRIIDGILYGINKGKLMFIISARSHAIKDVILKDVARGATIIKSTGAYSGEESSVLLCAVRKAEVFKIRDIVERVDPKAFVVVGEASEVLGEGFGKIKQ